MERRPAGKVYQHDLRPVSELRSHAKALLRSVKRTRRPVVLTQDGVPECVLLDVASYALLRETALLLEVMAMGRSDGRPARRRRPRRAARRR
jgi:prevent-host-death family protein